MADHACGVVMLTVPADFDLVLRDACFWPGALIQDLLGIDSVELWPTALLLPWLWEKEHAIPNPVAYLPQYAIDYTPHMVMLLQMPMAS